jgi:hypothetical protein
MKEGWMAIIWRKKETRQKKPDFKYGDYNKQKSINTVLSQA